jgi:hypothetical protein
MAKLKIGLLQDDKPVKMTVELPGQIHRDLIVYAEVLSRERGVSVSEPSKLIAPMLRQFMASDRAFRKSLRVKRQQSGG